MPDEIVYLDSYAYIGQRGPIDPEARWSTDSLIDEMSHVGIHGALVTHSIAKEYDPAYGNDLLTDELAKNPRLLGCWVLLPHHFGEMVPGGQLVEQMLDNGIRAARLCPNTHHYTLDKSTSGEILSALEAQTIPLCIEGSAADYGTLGWLCEAYPKLPVLFQQNSWADIRKLLPIMDRCDNLHTEFSTNQSNYAIERFAERYGAERLLLGTEAQFKSPGAAKAFVDYSELSDRDRRLIAGGNLARLLKLEELPQLYPTNPNEGSVLQTVKAGRPLEILVIDAHTHINPVGLMGVGHHPQPFGDVGGMVSRNRRLGIDRFCPSAWLGIWTGIESANESVSCDVREKYPDDVIPYATLNPSYIGDFPAAIRHAHEDLGCLGIKPYYPRTLIPYDSPRWAPWFEYGDEHHLYCLLHASANFSNEVARISDLYPHISFLLAHSGGSFDVARSHVALANEHKNVFLEITLTPVTHGVIEYMAGEVGVERVIFGTDAPMRDPAPQLGWLAYSRFTDDELALMFGKNMEAIVSRCKL